MNNEERQTTLDANEAAEMLRINPRTLKNLARKGEVPHFMIAGKYRFPSDLLDQLSEDNPAMKKLRREKRRNNSPQHQVT